MYPLIRTHCCICDSSLYTPFYSLPNVPIKLACVSTPTIQKESLSFCCCNKCQTIQLRNLIPLDILYSESHNYVSVGQTWENYFQCMREILQPLTHQKTILEIGDPSAKLANHIDNYHKWYIVEPNKNPNIVFHPNIKFIPQFFDYRFSLSEPVDIIVHSHVFEHMYEPVKFLQKCWELLRPDGEMVFAIPDMEYIADRNLAPFLGIFFEHTVFLSRENIRYLLESTGFTLETIIPYKNHSIIFRARKTFLPDQPISVPVFKNHMTSFLNSLDQFEKYVEIVNKNLSKHKNKPIYIFSASYNTQLLLALGIQEKKIDGILDNSREKQGKYLYGTSLKIFSPNETLKEKQCVVILKNGYYLDEIMMQIANLNSTTILIM